MTECLPSAFRGLSATSLNPGRVTLVESSDSLKS